MKMKEMNVETKTEEDKRMSDGKGGKKGAWEREGNDSELMWVY